MGGEKTRRPSFAPRRNLLSGPPPDAGVAQLVEHVIRNDGVGGSSPFTGTTVVIQRRPVHVTGLLASCPIFSGAGDRNQASRCQGALARIVPAASPETCGFGETRRFTAPMGCRDQSFAASLGSHPRCHAKNGPCTRARTGKPEGGRFSYHFDFRRRPPGRSWSGLSLGPSAICALGPARLVSTPSAPDIRPAGLARDRHRHDP